MEEDDDEKKKTWFSNEEEKVDEKKSRGTLFRATKSDRRSQPLDLENIEDED